MPIIVKNSPPSNIQNDGAPPDAPYRSIQVTRVQPGQGDILATLDVKIGGVFIRGVSLRRGRNDSIYINYPSYKNEHDRWTHVVEITSPQLEAAVRETIYRAVAEVLR